MITKISFTYLPEVACHFNSETHECIVYLGDNEYEEIKDINKEDIIIDEWKNSFIKVRIISFDQKHKKVLAKFPNGKMGIIPVHLLRMSIEEEEE